MEATHHISPTLTVSVEQGEYGPFIKIKRNEKWISLSASLWDIINCNLPKLRNVNHVLYLTKEKRLEVISFKDKRYVSFIHKTTHQGSDYMQYINFNDDEWTVLLQHIDALNNSLKSTAI